MMDPVIKTYLVYVLILSLVFGGAAQFSRFCLLGGMGAWLDERDGRRLAVYFAAIGVAIIATTVAQLAGSIDLNATRPPYRTPEFAWGRYVIGGFLFGVGMVWARGCPVRSLVKLSQGNLQALLAVFVMALGAYAMTRTGLYQSAFLPWMGHLSLDLGRYGIAHQDLASLFGGGEMLNLILALVLAAVLLLFSWRALPLRGNGRAWIGVLLIGAVVGAAFWVTGGAPGQAAEMASEMQNAPQQGLGTQSFTFSAPMGDVVYYLQHIGSLATVTFGVVAVVGLLLGSFASTMSRREFRLSLPVGWREWVRTIIGAALVGIGSVLAMGCTVGHGLTGISTLALGSMLSLTAIMLGAWVALRFDRRAFAASPASTVGCCRTDKSFSGK